MKYMPKGIYSDPITRGKTISEGLKLAYAEGKRPRVFSGVKSGFKKGMTPWNKGKAWSQEMRIKLAKSAIGKHKVNSGSIKKGENRLAILACQKLNKTKEPTSIEKKLYEELKARGLLFESQKVINNRFVVDAYIPSLNLIVEADGDYWHSLEKTMKKDKKENAYLTKCGYKLIRLSETEINDGSFRRRLD